jgi:cobalamin biosynthesis Mg chelatase CobN
MKLIKFSLFIWVALAAIAVQLIVSEAPADLQVEDDIFVQEETVEAAPGQDEKRQMDPKQQEIMEKVMSKLTEKCLKEVIENPENPDKISDKCKKELQRKLQRVMEAEQRKAKRASASKSKTSGTKDGKKKKKKSKRARQADIEAKKQEDHDKALKVIIGFVVTLVAIVVGAIIVINKRLKDAGMYYPAPTDPQEKGGGCCGGH